MHVHSRNSRDIAEISALTAFKEFIINRVQASRQNFATNMTLLDFRDDPAVRDGVLMKSRIVIIPRKTTAAGTRTITQHQYGH